MVERRKRTVSVACLLCPMFRVMSHSRYHSPHARCLAIDALAAIRPTYGCIPELAERDRITLLGQSFDIRVILRRQARSRGASASAAEAAEPDGIKAPLKERDIP